MHILRILSPARRFSGIIAILLCVAVALSACSAYCKAEVDTLPRRTVWPTLAPYPGATALPAPAPSNAAEVVHTLAFQTTATPEQVLDYYRATLQPQGWKPGAPGHLIDYRSCPKLALSVAVNAPATTPSTYLVTMHQYACRDYC